MVRSMRDALARLVCGPAWMQAERTFEDSAQDEEAIAVLGDAISGRKDWQNFPARKSKLLNTSKTNSKKWVLTSAQAWAVMA